MEIVNRVSSQLEKIIKPQGVKVLSVIGFVYVVSKYIKALRSLFKTFVHFGHNLPQRYGPGSWVLITGGANGIGAAFASQLAAKGFNLVLMDVDEVGLALTATKITTQNPSVLIKTIICDFSKVWQEGYLDFLDKEIEGLDISILINNVGRGCGTGPLHSSVEKQVIDTVAVNLLTMTLFTRKIVPRMLKRPQRSAIINLSSVSALYPWPSLVPVYGATKAFVDILSRSVSEEVEEKIDVMTVRPCGVSTDLMNNPPLNSYIITPASAVTAILKKLGRVQTASGHWRHEIKTWITHSALLRRLGTRAIVKQLAIEKAQAEAAAAAAKVNA